VARFTADSVYDICQNSEGIVPCAVWYMPTQYCQRNILTLKNVGLTQQREIEYNVINVHIQSIQISTQT